MSTTHAILRGASCCNKRTRAAVLGTAIGSNLGANLTPIGALAGIMWMTILSGEEVRISFVEFVKYGPLVTPASLLACRGVLALQLDLAA